MDPSAGQKQLEEKIVRKANEELEDNQETEELEITQISKENSQSSYSKGRGNLLEDLWKVTLPKQKVCPKKSQLGCHIHSPWPPKQGL